MDDYQEFRDTNVRNNIQRQLDVKLKEQLLQVQIELDRYKFGYTFEWLGVPIIRHNLERIKAHRMYKNITLIEGNILNKDTIKELTENLGQARVDILVLDSNHTHEHVLEELQLLSGFVAVGGYIVLPDTVIEDFPQGYYSDNRPWDVGNNPKTALLEFLSNNNKFEKDLHFSSKAALSESPDGYIRKIRD